VKHDILLAKLEYFGINGKVDDLIKSYLNDKIPKNNNIKLIFQK